MPTNIKEARNYLLDCDAILVIAGAGMSVDSGISTYRCFKSNFYNIMTSKEPHDGYIKLLNFLTNVKKNNYFICTSNIDNYFEKVVLIKIKFMKFMEV